MIRSEFQTLITKYERHLKRGEQNASDLKKISKIRYQHQKNLNALWRIFIKDLKDLSEKIAYDTQKTRN